MNDVREVIAEAIPCNIVYGRPQAADDIMRALTSAGFRILGPDEIDGPTVEKCAEVADEYATRKDILHSSIHFHVCANRLRALKT